MRALIDDHGASVNATDGGDRTALHVAAEAGSIDAVAVLLSYPDCDFNLKDRDGEIAEDCAIFEGHHDIAALIKAKSNGNFTEPL